MKKKLFIVLTILCLICLIFVACQPSIEDPNEDDNKDNVSIVIRGDTTQELSMGDIYKIVYRVVGSDVGVEFTSSDASVIEVDDFGNVSAVGAGSAVVTVSLKGDSSISKEVTFNVTKEFFYTKKGYIQGGYDLAPIDGSDIILLKGDQAIVVTSDCAENWYFACTFEPTGEYTNYDAQGRFGVGSFNIDDKTPIGDVMAWFGLYPINHRIRTYYPVVGGWRVLSGGADPIVKVLPDGQLVTCKTVKMELIRYGTMHYFTLTASDGTVAKYAYDCPSFDGVATRPGVFSQSPETYVYDYEVSTDMDVVMNKLNNFQAAEEISIDGLNDILYAGESYNLSSTVLPDATFDKSVTYSLSEEKAGVTITADGKLTIADSVSGEITVVATANSNNSVTATRTYSIMTILPSTSDILETGKIVGEAKVENDVISTSDKIESFIPLKVRGNSYSVSIAISNAKGNVGIKLTDNGYIHYADILVESGYKTMTILNGSTSENFTCSSANLTSCVLQIVRSGSKYGIIYNGRLIKVVNLDIEGDVYPVIYSDGQAIISDITVQNNADALEELEHTVGAFVNINSDGSYTLSQKNFGSSNDINWPPVNDFQNGLKSTQSFVGDFSIEFTLSDIKPMLSSGAYDSKVLVYLRTESKTASLQFVVKGTANAPKLTFCPNLDDATWEEYDMPDGIDLLSGSNRIKIVKQNDRVELYINNERVFESNTSLCFPDKWNDSTVFTPGIGSFSAGATISDIKFEEIN